MVVPSHFYATSRPPTALRRVSLLQVMVDPTALLLDHFRHPSAKETILPLLPLSVVRTRRWWRVSALLALTSCAAAKAPPAVAVAPAAPEKTLAEKLEQLRSWRAREQAAVVVKPLALFDGLAAGEIESLVDPKPNCKKSNLGGDICSFELDLGKSSDGDPVTIDCSATTDLEAYGTMLNGFLGERQLEEIPSLETKAVSEGLSVGFVTESSHRNDEATEYTTTKVRSLFAHGYMVTCFNQNPGFRQTFTRVTQHLFETLKFKDNPKAPTIFALSYQERAGDRTSGFRVVDVAKRNDSNPGFFESNIHFLSFTDGKTWRVLDVVRTIDRDTNGQLEKMNSYIWQDGKGPLKLMAKPGEDKKLRLKIEAGEKAVSVESTPKAPLTSELWIAPELVKVNTGKSQSYRYAFLDILDSDPAFHYITLTRTAPGVVLEYQEPLVEQGKKANPGDEGTSKDELHVDARGIVTKEVSTDSVSELLQTWGDLPPILTAAKAQAGSGKKKKP